MKGEIGVVLSADYIPISNIIELSPMLDNLGYAQVSVPEIWGHDAITLLSALAQTTKKIRLATGIISMYSRTPALVAMTSVSINELSNGRFVLGLGLSGPKVIENLHGIKFSKPLMRTREFVDVTRTLINEKRLNHETSQLGHLKDFKLSIRSIKNIPIHIAALGPKNIELTAEIADGWIPVIMPYNALNEQISQINKHLVRFNKNPSDFSITPFVIAIAGDSVEKMELLRNHLFYYFATMGDFYNNMLKRAGFVDEAIEIKEKYHQGDIEGSKRAVTDEIIDKTCIYGSTDQIQEKIARLYKIGVTCPLISMPFKTKVEDAMHTFQKLAPAQMSF